MDLTAQEQRRVLVEHEEAARCPDEIAQGQRDRVTVLAPAAQDVGKRRRRILAPCRALRAWAGFARLGGRCAAIGTRFARLTCEASMKTIVETPRNPRDGAASRSRDTGLGRLRALVADDDEQTLHMVAQAVELFGAEVTCASTGGELIEALGAGKPFDLIVTDVAMPWMTGLQVMHSVRTAGLHTPVVVMTALQDPSVAAQASRLGHDAVLLRKPFNVDALHAAIRGVLGRVASA
jgi:CheY-like chemotaxis protein